MIWPIFIIGALLIVILQLWYVNRKKPLSDTEISAYLEHFIQHPQQHTELEVFKKFLQDDDGKEICMVNLVSLYKGQITHPLTGKQVASHKALQDYMKTLMSLVAKKACHPIFVAYKAGGHIDSWGSDEHIDFLGLQLMRYRSRRDFVDLLLHSKMEQGLEVKFAAIEKTITYPAQMRFSTYLRPNMWLSMVILLVCCVLQIGLTL